MENGKIRRHRQEALDKYTFTQVLDYIEDLSIVMVSRYVFVVALNPPEVDGP